MVHAWSIFRPLSNPKMILAKKLYDMVPELGLVQTLVVFLGTTFGERKAYLKRVGPTSVRHTKTEGPTGNPPRKSEPLITAGVL